MTFISKIVSAPIGRTIRSEAGVRKMIITSGEMKLKDGLARRSLPRRHQKFIIDFPSLKNGRSMERDAVLESAYCIWLEHDPQVVKHYTPGDGYE